MGRDTKWFVAFAGTLVAVLIWSFTYAATNYGWHQAAIEAGVGQWVMDETSGEVHFEFKKAGLPVID